MKFELRHLGFAFSNPDYGNGCPACPKVQQKLFPCNVHTCMHIHVLQTESATIFYSFVRTLFDYWSMMSYYTAHYMVFVHMVIQGGSREQ